MHTFPPQGVAGMLAYICVFFVSVITIASCADDKSLGEIKDNTAGDFSSPADASRIDRHNSLMQITLININLKAIPHAQMTDFNRWSRCCYDFKKTNPFTSG